MAHSSPAQFSFGGFVQDGKTPTVFALFADFGDSLFAKNPGWVASMVKRWRPDFIIAPGDLNYGQPAVGHEDWEIRIGVRYGDFILGRADKKYPLQSSPVQRFFPAVGNHDTSVGGLGGGDVTGYVDYFVHDAPGNPPRLPTGQGRHDDEVSYYDFVHDDMHFVVADSDRGRVDGQFAADQNAWIDRVLTSSTARWKFLICHHPPYSSDGAHGNQVWMHGDHLFKADAVFSGHAHLYERIEVEGTPFFISGFGGRPRYPFSETPIPESKFRYNAAGDAGAIRVTKNDTGVLIEFRSLADGSVGARGGALIDWITLGDFAPVVPFDERVIDILEGQNVTFETTTPAANGVPADQLDPKIELLRLDGGAVAGDESGASDGRNARLEFAAENSGRYLLRVSPQGGTSGFHRIAIDYDPPLPLDPFEVWQVRMFGAGAGPAISGPGSDPDGDTLTNLFEYGVGSDPDDGGDPEDPHRVFSMTRMPGLSYAETYLREGYRPDLVYAISSSNRWADDGRWRVIAIRRPDRPWWDGELEVVESFEDEGKQPVRLRVADPVSPRAVFHRNKLYRLSVHRFGG